MNFSIACQELPPTRKIVSSSLPVKQLWQTQLKEPSSASPILTNRVIIAQTSVALYGLDKDSGQQLWKHTFNSRQPTPAPIIAQGNLVFLGDNDGMVTALDTVSGEVNWQRQHCGKESGYYTIESIVTDQERVYVASQPTAIEAIYLDNGSISWNHCKINDTVFPSRGARLFIGENESLYVATTEVHILNLNTGSIEQMFEQNLAGIQHLVDGRFYGRNWVRDAYSMEMISMLTSPSYKPLYGSCEDFRRPFTFSPNNMYAVGSCGGVFSLDLDNYTVTESYLSNLDVATPVTIYHNLLYALTSNGEVHAIDPVTRLNAGVLRTNKNVDSLRMSSSGVTSDNEVLIVTFGDRDIFTFKGE